MQVGFPTHVDVCDKSICDDSSLVTRLVANLSLAVLETAAVGFKVGSIGRVIDVPTSVAVTYHWVGIRASMVMDPIVWVDGQGQFFAGSIDVKVGRSNHDAGANSYLNEPQN